jgi:probable F420-dependent oxidoreductase
MSEVEVVEAARRALGPVGVLLPVTLAVPASIDRQRQSVVTLEGAGLRAAWTNELLGKDALVQLALLLGATEAMTFGTGIANIWLREPQTLRAAAAELAQGYPDRFVLGMGVGYRQQAETVGKDFGQPVDTMRDYLVRMDGPTWVPVPEARYPRIIAANGPKMLALAGEVADGAFPAGLSPEFTEQARVVLGPHRLLVVGLSIILDESQQANPDHVVEAVQGHLSAGADHVVVMLPMGGDYTEGVDQLAILSPHLARTS